MYIAPMYNGSIYQRIIPGRKGRKGRRKSSELREVTEIVPWGSLWGDHGDYISINT